MTDNADSTQTLGYRRIKKIDDTCIISTIWLIDQNLTQEDTDSLVGDIITYCTEHNLQATYDTPYHLKVYGQARHYEDAFKVDMYVFLDDEDNEFHMSIEDIHIKPEWNEKITNILGLDTRKIVKPYFCLQTQHTLKRLNDLQGNYLRQITPLQFAALYDFPQNLNGLGQKIGIIELGGGYVLSDIQKYFTDLGITDAPNITSVSVDGATNNPSDTSGANVEVVLDTEIIAALVPKAAIFVYFAPNSFAGFYNAINKAIMDECNIISISWGAPESNWTRTNLSSYNSLFQTGANKGISIFAASGDRGSSDGTLSSTTDFPASSPYVVACGGTTLQTDDGSTILREYVWNNNSMTSATGGGVSKVFAIPSYQLNVTYNLNGKRGVPDICGNADPNTGYKIYSAGEGGYITVGGTSAVSPLWSGLTARINQSTASSIGFIQPKIYTNLSACRDILVGNNGAYVATSGWDPCTGCGSPNGTALLAVFSNKLVANFNASPLSGNAPLTVNFTDASTGTPTAWAWDFGDGTYGDTQNPSHVYNNAGTYSVSLTVTNNSGSNSVTRSNYISATNSPAPDFPVASFNASPLVGNAPLTVKFTDTSTGTPTAWAWDFGDGTYGDTQNPSHVYNNAGTYSVSLTVTNTSGSNSVNRSNYIFVDALLPAFVGQPLSGVRPLRVNFTNLSTGSPTSYLWEFGDGSKSNTKNPYHVYARNGNFSVKLTITDNISTKSLLKSKYITVKNAQIAASFSTRLLNAYSNTVQYTDTSKGSPTKWLWDFGDGTSSTLRHPIHSYKKNGTYTVKLEIMKDSEKSNFTQNIAVPNGLIKKSPTQICNYSAVLMELVKHCHLCHK